jgi:AbrB family looped-hinge helix DNA binding protein
MESTITSKGQTTIPKQMRDHLGVKPGDRLKFFIDPYGHVVILPKLPASSIRGIVCTTKRASIEDMDRAVADEIASRFERSNRP